MPLSTGGFTMRTIQFLCVSILSLMLVYSASGQIPKMISYQGLLTDSVGTPRPDGTYSFTFRLYQTSSGGSALWTEQKTLQTQRGLFSTNLGDQVTFPGSLAFDRQYWLGIQVAANPEMTPRTAMTSSAYSMNSVRSDTARFALSAPGQSFVDSARVTGTVTPNASLSIRGLSIGVANEGDRALRLLSGPNAFLDITPTGPSPFSTVLGTVNNRNFILDPGTGNIGIGTTSPQARLDIAGPGSGGLWTTNGWYKEIQIPNGSVLKWGANAGGMRHAIGSTTGGLYFARAVVDDSSASALYSMIVTDNGKVGIGLTNPTARLQLMDGSGTPTTTGASFNAENFGTSGEGAWLRNASSSNPYDVVKLVRHPSAPASSSFIAGYSWTGTGTDTRMFHITSAGTFVAGSDFAEAFEASGGKASYEPGDVVVLSKNNPKAIEKSSIPYDTKVAGIYSTRPGVLGADKDGITRMDENDIPVAIVGIVPTKVTDENGPIESGDLLTTSSLPGHAMKASPVVINGTKIYPTGAIVGKALDQLVSGQGTIKILVTIK
jgi:hypothetical protein